MDGDDRASPVAIRLPCSGPDKVFDLVRTLPPPCQGNRPAQGARVKACWGV